MPRPIASRRSRSACAFASLLLGASSALAQNVQYPVTVFAGESYTYHGFGFSQGTGGSSVPPARPFLLDLSYDAFRVQHLRLFTTIPGRGVYPADHPSAPNQANPNPPTYAGTKSAFVSRYIATGLTQQIQARGATILQLSPGTDKDNDSAPRIDQPAEIQAYAQNIANLIRDLWDEYRVRIAVTAVQNEANTQRVANGWSYEVVREVTKALRTALDTTTLSTGGTLSYVEILPTESASVDNTHLAYINEIINDQDAYDSTFAFGSHAYGASMSGITESRIWGRHNWMNEAAANGFDSPTYDTEAAKVPGRFYNDLNQGASLWTYFIGYGLFDNTNGNDDEATKMVTWDFRTRQLRVPLKYHYALPMVRAFEPGTSLRRSFNVSDGTGRWGADQTRSAVFTLAGIRPDGAWAVGVVNNSGITNPTNHPSAQTYDVNITVQDLVGQANRTFAAVRSRVDAGVPVNAEYAGTITSNNGLITVPNLLPREAATLVEITAAPAAPTHVWAHTRNEGGRGEAYVFWNPAARAVTYNVQRASSASGPWTTLATGITRNHYIDPNPAMGATAGAAGAPQFYRVVASNHLGSAAATAALPVNPRFSPIVDNLLTDSVVFSGTWATATNSGDYDDDYRAASAFSSVGLASVTVTPRIPNGGLSGQIYLWWPNNNPSSRSATTRVTVVHAGGTSVVNINQRTSGASGWNLLPGGPYTFAAGTAGSVTVSNADSNDGSILFDAVRFGEDPSPAAIPAAPGSLAARAVAPRQVVLRWTDYADNETGFVVERSTGGGAYVALAPNPAIRANDTAFADTTVAPGTSYSYRVRAVNNGGANSSAFTNVVTVATPATPAAPTGLVASTDERDVLLTWTDNAVGEFTYLVERKGPADADWVEHDVVRGAANINGAARPMSFRDRFTAENTVYFYRVRAVSQTGDLSAYSNSAYTVSGIDGLVIDTDAVSPFHVRSGNWDTGGTTNGGFVGGSYIRGNQYTGDTAYVRFNPSPAVPTPYYVSLRWPQGGGFAFDARLQLGYGTSGGTIVSTTVVNQTADGGRWYPLGKHTLGSPTLQWAQIRRSITNPLTGGRHITSADAARFVKVPFPQATRFAEADSYVDGANTTTNYGTNVQLIPENKGGTTIRKAYLRFDVNDCVPVSAATLRLISSSTGTGTHTFTVYGLTNGLAGDAPVGWTEGGINWTNAPANTTGNGFTADAVNLGSFTTDGTTANGTPVNFSSAALNAFLNADTNGKVTLMIVRSASTGYTSNTRFHSKENTTPFVTAPALITTGQ